jgi:hypothetical protein
MAAVVRAGPRLAPLLMREWDNSACSLPERLGAGGLPSRSEPPRDQVPERELGHEGG